MTRSLQMTVIVWLAALTVAAAALPLNMPPVLRLVFAAPFVVFLPGYAVLGRHFSGLTAFTLSSGVSFAITILWGFVLHVTTGLTPLAWALALTGTTLAALLVRPGSRPEIVRKAELARMAPSAAQFVIAGTGALLLATSIGMARSAALSYQPFPVTELWMVPSTSGPQNTFTVGIANRERAPMVYDLRLTLNGIPVKTFHDIMLDDGETWTADMPIALKPADRRRFEAWLIRTDRPETVYRRAWLQVTPTFELAGRHVQTSAPRAGYR